VARQLLAASRLDRVELEGILDDIEKDDERAVAIIRRMHMLGKKGEVELEPLDVHELVRDVVRVLQNDAHLRGVRMIVQLEDHPAVIQGDRVQLLQVLMNLLLNAFDAMETCDAAGREVIVRSRRDADRSVQITVSDQGTGIPGDRLEKVFEAFFTTKKHGLGLGLAVSRSIIEAHGGRLWTERNPERGVTFSFLLPVADPARVAPEAHVHHG
jgi:two-component system sensor kinase FixL